MQRNQGGDPYGIRTRISAVKGEKPLDSTARPALGAESGPIENNELGGRGDGKRLLVEIAQLRHAYAHLKAGRVVEQAMFADGLIAPTVRYLEGLAQRIEARSDETVQPAQPEGREPDGKAE